jgi:hypothetical protein
VDCGIGLSDGTCQGKCDVGNNVSENVTTKPNQTEGAVDEKKKKEKEKKKKGNRAGLISTLPPPFTSNPQGSMSSSTP